MEIKTIFHKYLTFKPSIEDDFKIHFDIRLTQHNGANLRDWDTLEVVENPIGLSIVGRCDQNFGQCQNEIRMESANYNPKDKELINKLLDIWDEHHKNIGLHLTKRQNEVLEKLYEADENVSVRQLEKHLSENNLLEDKGYKYDFFKYHLFRPIPQDVIDFIKGL